MSKREHIKSESYIDWLKSLGCILYIPFDGTYGTTDLISGASISHTGYGSLQYDSNYDMYQFNAPSSQKTRCYTINNGWNASLFTANEYTVMTSIKKVPSYNLNVFIGHVGNTWRVPMGFCPTYNGTGNCSRWYSNDMHKVSQAFSTTKRSAYQDGTLYSEWNPYSIYLPSAWGSYEWWLGTGDAHELGSQNAKLYIKDVMCFNRYLDLTTIRKIQGYE